ncbi:MAG: hypothetical protein ABIF92_01335 [archaeon]
MNKAIFAIFAILILVVPVLAANEGAQNTVQTQNSGEDSNVQIQLQDGANDTETDDEPVPELISVETPEQERARERIKEAKIEQKEEKYQLKSGEVTADSQFVMTKERETIMVQLNNNIQKELKVLPDTASEKAVERARLRKVVSVELQEENGELVYEVVGERPVKVLGLFKAQMRITTRINAENNAVKKIKQPWWAIFASDDDEAEAEEALSELQTELGELENLIDSELEEESGLEDDSELENEIESEVEQ